MIKVYAGVGSRETPPDVCEMFAFLAGQLGAMGWTLRSGRAIGADQAFECGARAVHGKCEIFLPDEHKWKPIHQIDNQVRVSYMDEVTGSVEACKLIARLTHPYGKSLRPESLELHARNTYQILGQDLNTPADLVICWTENGSGKGGTGQAIRLAKLLNIPIIDFGIYQTKEEAYSMVEYIINYYGKVL